jgi:hypothetical protein
MPEPQIPPSKQATQIPPPTGEIQQFLVRMLGFNYRTTMAGWAAGLSGLAAFITMSCPHLMLFEWDKKEAISLFWAIICGGGVIKGFSSAKDKSTTGVEK